jgi:hypothetical protein
MWKEENAAGAKSGPWLENEKKMGLRVDLGRKFSWGIGELERTREGR